MINLLSLYPAWNKCYRGQQGCLAATGLALILVGKTCPHTVDADTRKANMNDTVIRLSAEHVVLSVNSFHVRAASVLCR